MFDDIPIAQWHFYSEMINQDQKKELDHEIAITEYLASFWNPEAVQKIKEQRISRETHNFKNDEEFEQHVLSGDYKSSPILDAVRKLRELEQNYKTSVPEDKARSTKLPKDLSTLKSVIEDF